jgi:hypothetical protein
LLLTLVMEMMTALHQIEGGGEEPEVEWSSWCTGLQSSCDLCEKCQQSSWAGQTTCGMQLSIHMHSFWNVPGRKVCIMLHLVFINI